MSDQVQNKRIVIIPCSGIGKTYGTVSREAAFIVNEEFRPATTRLIALSKLVMGDEEAWNVLTSSQVITVDGCKLACATKMVQESGSEVAQDYDVLEVYRRYRQFKPQGIVELNEGGRSLAEVLANEISQKVDELINAGDIENG